MIGSSEQYTFQPSISELTRTAFARIQIYSPALTIAHLVDARIAANLILSDWAANRGVNLSAVDLVPIALVPGVATYVLPDSTIDLLDVYIRSVTPNATTTNIGTALTPLGPPGNPLVTQPYGDPLLLSPGSGTLLCTAGNQYITLKWPAHGLNQGDPIFWGCPVSIGAVTISQLSFVSSVIDSNTVQFIAPTPALETQTLQGGTPLFSTTLGSSTVDVIQPGHGMSVGDIYPVPISTTVGGLTLSGNYTVLAVNSSYEFTFGGGSNATATASVFENGGQLNVTSQSPGIVFTDVPMFPFSRTDWVSLAYKDAPGKPTSFWLDRVVPPRVTTYPVAPAPNAAVEETAPNLVNPGATSVQFYGMLAYRMREFQDANPVSGQTIDAPRRMWAAFTSALCAALAEIYRPEAWAEKRAAAEADWMRASAADTERVTLNIQPAFQNYYR